MDLGVAVAGFAVGIVVGLTGMGGGALMTPLLVLFFGVAPLSAVSSDLVASAVMKPFGAAVHLHRGTVHRDLVLWLCVGSVPSAFAGVFVARALGRGESVQSVVQVALGAALLLAAAGLIVKAVLALTQRTATPGAAGPVSVRRTLTVLSGAVGGLVVGVTSVGSGSLIVIGLLALYPMLRANDLVGTDLVQAVPLVTAAALAHLLYGEFQLGLTVALVLGSVPGVLVGALLSARAPGGLIRAALCVVLVASGLKLLGAAPVTIAIVVMALIVASPVGYWAARRRYASRPAAGDHELTAP